MRIRLSMTESQKRMRPSSSPSNATAAVKKQQVSSAQRPSAAAASPVAGGGGPAANQAADTAAVVVVDKDLWLHCSACSAALKPPIYKCETAGHKVCSACRGAGTTVVPSSGSNQCWACADNGAAAAASAYTRCSGDDLDALMGALRVPCPHSAYGCSEQVPYHALDGHRLSCLDAPCSCSVSPCSSSGIDSFLGSPRGGLLAHLTGPAHSWPTATAIDLGKAQQLDLAPAGPNSCRLLVCERQGRVFLLVAGGYTLAAAAAAAGETAATTISQVSLTCLRAAAAGPHYRARLWAHAPRDPVSGVEDRQEAEFLVESRASPYKIGVEEDGTVLSLKRKFLHGDGEEERKIRIDKLRDKSPAPASS